MRKILFFSVLFSVLMCVQALNAQSNKKNKNKGNTQTSTQPTPAVNNPKANENVVLNDKLPRDNSTTVEAKGVGVRRDDALQDALRNAVGQAVGVALTSESAVENFVLIKDAISTHTEGYISSYKVVNEAPFPDRYEITVSATVSLSPLKADAQVLAQSIGGVRFLVMYDPSAVKEDEVANYDFACERINEYLAERKYRYIDRKRFESLKKEAIGIYQNSETNQETFVQRIGMMADAQFIIFISKISVTSRSEAFDTRTSSKISIEARAYDNCTAEGLGTIAIESDWKGSRDPKTGINDGIKEAVNNNFSKLLYLFNQYVGNWVNNGTPFELRFYSIGTFRDFRDLRAKMLADPKFGGQLEILSFNNYTKLNLTFKDKPDELAYKVLDYADAIPEFKNKVLDVKLIYGRQINFAPQKVNVPELQPAAGAAEPKPATGTKPAQPKPDNNRK